jgi:DNA polymerase-3 subunit epsilon
MILFLDLETSGLPTPSPEWLGQPGIVQIGAVKVWEGCDGDTSGAHGEADSFYTNVNPEGVKWSDEAIKVHGITPDAVADAPTFFEIGPALANFALGCRAWGGYNTKFDRDVLWHQLNRYGLERNFPWPPEEIDVMKLAEREMEIQGKRGMKRPKLSEAYQFFVGMPLSGAHDALADIRATVEVWRKINV